MYRFLRVVTVAILLGSASGSLRALEADALERNDVYLSPTRLRQSPHETPESVSRVGQETIRDLQITSIPELLNYVAGMLGGYSSGNAPRISYHGTNATPPRRMQVLIDGVSIFRPSVAEVDWVLLPISIHDIDVVEVTRGPSAVTYGENAMMAVVNIKTKDPRGDDTLGAVASVGSNDRTEVAIQSAGEIVDRLRYRVSLSGGQDDGFDTGTFGADRHDGFDAERLHSRLDYRPAPNTDVTLMFAYSRVGVDIEARDPNQLTFPDGTTRTRYVMADLRHAYSPRHDIRLKAYYTHAEQDLSWRTCYPALVFSENLGALHAQNPAYAQALVRGQLPIGGSPADDVLRNAVLAEAVAMGPAAVLPLCGWVDEDSREHRGDFELQDTWVVSDELRIVSGFGAAHKELTSQAYLDGSAQIAGFRLFANAEYRWDRFVFNLGGFLEEEESTLDDPILSPRFATNYRLSEASTLRLVYSRAKRSPDILEQDLRWNYVAHELEPAYPLDGRRTARFYFTNVADGDLRPEEISSRSVSLYTRKTFPLREGLATWTQDLKLFSDELRDLISEKFYFYTYEPTNDGKVDLVGFEAEMEAEWRDVLWPKYVADARLHANYAYLDNDTNAFYERSLYARHSGAAYGIVTLRGGWQGTLGFLGRSKNIGESFFGWELGLGKTVPLGEGSLALQAKAVWWPDRKQSFVGTESQTHVNYYDDATRFYLTAEYRLPPRR